MDLRLLHLAGYKPSPEAFLNAYILLSPAHTSPN